ncbi:OmpA family protein [Chitinophaga pendula]|uniref:OmpA family protein n=1 Tax=Chitinophaga TaxID=79328 RepID=UPI000BAF5682|nr:MULTISPECIES: OmpA family protein [Chitinophaga]ASZ14219.1 flagellar motor protein MotB [Chitinophaga sp. MD30]UCJ08141.1 OmpA family protein [Chitinophaga pendula]
MKRILFTATILFSVIHANAQFTYDYLKAADNYYKRADYASAAQYYEKYLGNRKKVRKEAYNPYVAQGSVLKPVANASSEQQAVYQLADSYRQLNNYQKAAPWYEEVLEFDKTKYPLAPYYYATSLRALAKYAEAEKAFSYFLEGYSTEDKYRTAAEREVKNLRFIQEQLGKKDLHLYTINKAGAGLNATGASYAPVWLDENKLLFTSTRPDNKSGSHVYINRVYQAEVVNGVAGKITKTELPQPAAGHQGVVSLTPDGQALFLTRWTIANGKKTSAIYTSKRNGDKWSDPVLLDATINVPGANTQQPFVWPDGKFLLFASDRSGGYGGFDIWYAPISEDGKVGPAANLGEVINTPDNEQAPFYYAPTATLVFSGDGRVGMGGYDFFYSKGSIGKWSEPVNFGHPVNSIKDDIYFVNRGTVKNILEEVFLSSDRSAECCLELFSLHRDRLPKKISGIVVSCDGHTPLPGATVNIVDPAQDNKIIHTQITGADGSYAFNLPDYQPLKAEAVADGYHGNTLQVSVPADDESLTLTTPELCLVKIVTPAKPEILENVYYDFNVATLRPESYPALDKLVEVLNQHPERVIELSAHTDSKGGKKFNQRLSEARAKSCLEYLVEKGIDRSRLKYKGYGASKPIAPNENPDGTDNPEGRQQNRRTEFTVLSN